MIHRPGRGARRRASGGRGTHGTQTGTALQNNMESPPGPPPVGIKIGAGRAQLHHGCSLSPILFVIFMDRISRCSCMEKNVQSGDLDCFSAFCRWCHSTVVWVVTERMRYKQPEWISYGECLGSALEIGWGAHTSRRISELSHSSSKGASWDLWGCSRHVQLVVDPRANTERAGGTTYLYWP